MASAGDRIENPATGEQVVFRRTASDTGGRLLELELFWTRKGERAPEHVHPEMEETWEVLSGRAAFRIGEEEIQAGPGETVVAPPGTAHVGWNPTDGEVRVRITMRPALRWEEFVERLFALARDPDSGRLEELLEEFGREVRPVDGSPAGPGGDR